MINMFLENEFSQEEVSDAISKLHEDKSPGFDDVTTEHLHLGRK